ncbi:MAG: putative sugar-phosphate transferase, rane protein, partial [Ramlibacter sp.]|nr:putative sugar-phosphate transferase, rane protein [Ramlibacter sp.]
MHEAEPLIAAAARPAISGIPVLGQSRLLRALEAIIEPLVTVLSLWLLIWHFEGTLTPLWLVASVVAFALAFPGRSLLRMRPDRVFVSILLAWCWTAGLLLAMAFATGS